MAENGGAKDEDGYGLQEPDTVIADLFKALDDCEEQERPVKELKRAVRETAKAKGAAVDVLTTVQKLRKLESLKAQAWVINFNRYVKIAGIWDQGDAFAEPPELSDPPPAATEDNGAKAERNNVRHLMRPARGRRTTAI